MNKEEFEAKLAWSAEGAPYLLRLALLIAQHPLRWTSSAFVLGLAAGLFL